jgi:hypothetical protein
MRFALQCFGEGGVRECVSSAPARAHSFEPQTNSRLVCTARLTLPTKQAQIGTQSEASVGLEERGLWGVLSVEAALTVSFFALAASLLWCGGG